VQWVSGLSWG